MVATIFQCYFKRILKNECCKNSSVNLKSPRIMHLRDECFYFPLNVTKWGHECIILQAFSVLLFAHLEQGALAQVDNLVLDISRYSAACTQVCFLICFFSTPPLFGSGAVGILLPCFSQSHLPFLCFLPDDVYVLVVNTLGGWFLQFDKSTQQ